MKKLFYVMLLSSILGISLIGCSSDDVDSNKENLSLGNYQVEMSSEKFVDFKVEDGLIMLMPEDYMNNYNLIAESLNYNKLNDFIKDDSKGGNSYYSNLDENTKLKLIQFEGDIGYMGIQIDHIIQEKDTIDNFSNFGNISFISALACKPISNQEILQEQLSKGLLEAISNKKSNLIKNDEFIYKFTLEDKIIKFQIIAKSTVEKVENNESNERDTAVEEPSKANIDKNKTPDEPKQEEASESPQVNEYEFTAGFYTVGEDIPVGKYNVEWISGSGVCVAGRMAEIFGDREGDIKSFQNINLEAGNEIQVNSSLKIKFIQK